MFKGTYQSIYLTKLFILATATECEKRQPRAGFFSSSQNILSDLMSPRDFTKINFKGKIHISILLY